MMLVLKTIELRTKVKQKTYLSKYQQHNLNLYLRLDKKGLRKQNIRPIANST